MRLAFLAALVLLAAGCVEPDEEPLAPGALAEAPPATPAGEEAVRKDAEAGEARPVDEPGANASQGPRTLTLGGVIEVDAALGAGGTPVAGRAKNAVLAVPEAGASAATINATWKASNPAAEELVLSHVVDGRLVEIGRGRSPLTLDAMSALALAGDHVLTASPATGAMARQTVVIEVVLTYG